VPSIAGQAGPQSSSVDTSTTPHSPTGTWHGSSRTASTPRPRGALSLLDNDRSISTRKPGSFPDRRRNLVWLYFAKRITARRTVGWQERARHLLGQFRADAAEHPGGERFAELIEALQEEGAVLRVLGPYNVEQALTGKITVRDPDIGIIHIDERFDIHAQTTTAVNHAAPEERRSLDAGLKLRAQVRGVCPIAKTGPLAHGSLPGSSSATIGSMSDIAQKELRNRVGEVLRRAEAGEILTVTVAGRPVAELGPAHRRRWVSGAALAGIWREKAPRGLKADLERLPAIVVDPFAS
jgi:prevent-host-death family protein